MSLKKFATALAVGLASAFMAGGEANAAKPADPLAFTCKNVQVDLPSGFGTGRWRLSNVVFEYPSATPAQFMHLARSRVDRCQKHGPNSRGYQVGTYHFTSHGPVVAKIRMSGCAPDGQRVYINIPVRLPVSGNIKLDRKDVSVRGRC